MMMRRSGEGRVGGKKEWQKALFSFLRHGEGVSGRQEHSFVELGRNRDIEGTNGCVRSLQEPILKFHYQQCYYTLSSLSKMFYSGAN